MMKKPVILSALLILLYSAAFSQDPEFQYYKSKEIKTLLGRNRAGGGYSAFTAGYSVIDDKHAVLFGGRFGWIASHCIGVGIGATGFINEFRYEPSLDREVFLAGGYGGLYIEPILMPRLPVHISFPVLFGAGGISYVSKESDLNNNLIEDSEAFLMIEPAAELELNLTRFFRFAIGASYRFPTSFNVGLSGTPTANAESIRGLSYMVTFKFGKF
jgi:opacity protein-like surface antigen